MLSCADILMRLSETTHRYRLTLLGIKRSAAENNLLIMAINFMKHYYALTSSKSKHVMTALEKRKDKFYAIMSIFGAGEGIKVTLEQYMKIYKKREIISEFFDNLEGFEFDFSDENSQFIVKSKTTQCKMMELKQIDKLTKQISTVFIINETFNKLMRMQSLLYHNLHKLERNIEAINNLYQERSESEFNSITNNQFVNGFDFTQFELELAQYDEKRGDADFLHSC
jgi:hypothetical protein